MRKAPIATTIGTNRVVYIASTVAGRRDVHEDSTILMTRGVHIASATGTRSRVQKDIAIGITKSDFQPVLCARGEAPL
jgi:hypothetical protein